MKINGPLVVDGYINDAVLSEEAQATQTGQWNNGRKGVLKFNNGFKIQWDGIRVEPNATQTITLLEPFTAEIYFVLVQATRHAGIDDQEDDISGYLWATTPLSTIRLRNQAEMWRSISYMVFGRDSI